MLRTRVLLNPVYYTEKILFKNEGICLNTVFSKYFEDICKMLTGS